MSRGYTATRTDVRAQGLWPLAAEPGESFRWGAVLRRSRLNPDGTEGSTARQERAIQDYVRQNAMGRIVTVYRDVESAYSEKAKREDYSNALDDLRAGRVDGLIAWKVDRLLRRRSESRKLVALLQECGGRLATVVEGLDTADPAKRQITDIALAVYAGSAEAEAEAMSERIRLMHLDRATKGLVQGGSARPFGHTDDWFGLVDGEVKILHEAAERLLAGEAAFSIARDFSARGIPTVRGNTHWKGEVLRRMLLSPRMVAKREYGGTVYELRDVPPIFDQETYERVCDAIRKRTHRSGPTEVHLLSNLAMCGICNGPLTSSKPQGLRDAYVCKKRGYHENVCGKISVVAMLADERVTEEVVKFLADKERVSALLRKQAGPELAAIQARETELGDSKHALAQALNPPPGKPRMPLEDYYEQVAIIEAERRELHRRMAVTREAALLAEVLDFTDAAHEWETRSLHWRRTILKLVTESIVIEPRGKLLPKNDPRYQPGFNAFDPERVRVKFAG